jgi:hypothetical protein
MDVEETATIFLTPCITARDIEMTAHYAKIILHIHHEMKLHVEVCTITSQRVLVACGSDYFYRTVLR